MTSKKFISPEIENNTIEELSKQLLKANTELKKLQEEREMMFANISHDLRAPMTAIRSAVDLALSEDRNTVTVDELRSTLELIDRRSKTLESLVNDMYYLYRVSNVAEEFKYEEIEAAPFLEEFFYDLTLEDKYDGFDLSLEQESGLSCKIKIDVQKIVRVLDNLFSNAAKYAGKGSKIVLRAGIENGMLKVSVIDNGKGIPKDKLPYIFFRTYTVSDARTPADTESGSGLGLAIAKSIIEKHGGSIECKSTEGEGTEFAFYIPAIL
ncbi:MAG: HAMP domain-containing histidine kinase [Lachnospiraceae bacterium]|nr:HAMP domain-containing histidine kinase [Lachnospiraceae bacterium]